MPKEYIENNQGRKICSEFPYKFMIRGVIMSNYDINSNPALVKLMIENSKKASEKYFAERPDSLIPLFEQELHALGFQFEVSEQIKQFLPKHKKPILPIAIKYYQQATYDNEKNFFISLFGYKGFEEVIPMLLNDFYSDKTASLTRQFIGETLRIICSKKYIDDYLRIIASPQYGLARAPIFSIVGKLKVEQAIPILINLLEVDEEFAPCALQTLGVYKRFELRPYFEHFINSSDMNMRKIASTALKKME